jgi:hypothetical protein
MSIKKFFKNYIVEQDENLVSVSPEDYLEILESVGGIAERISKLKPYRGKGIVITGPINVTNYKNIGPLTGVVRVMGRLDISHTNISNLNGITIDGYVSDYGSSMWKIKKQQELNEKLSDLDEKRREDEWNVENQDDESERTEAVYKYLNQHNDVDMVEDDEGNEVPEDKYYINPNGRATYGYGKQYEWLGGGNGFNPNEYDVYTEDEADSAAREYVEQLIDDSGIDAFSSWAFNEALDDKQWYNWLYNYYDDYVRSSPEDFDIPLELSNQQMNQVQQLQSNIDSLNKRLKSEDLPDEKYEEIEIKIEGLEEIIQEINDDPQGEYDESIIEDEITSRVDEYSDDIFGYIDDFGFDKNFIVDFIDLDKLTETIVSSDGYGSMLNSYDGDYDTFNINGTEYYVMRVN